MEPIFLTLDEVVEIHERQIELYGGSHGLRDPGALESAVATPQVTFGGEYLHPTLPEMAAAYLFIWPKTTRFSTGTSAAMRSVGASHTYTYSHEKYEPSFFLSGDDHGTPEEAFETSAQFY